MSKRQRRREQKQRRHQGERHRRRQIALGASLITGATLASAGTAHAVDSTVDNTGDATGGACSDAVASDCSLRSAIEGAADASDSDVINFASGLSGTIYLESDLPNIPFGDVDINGPGAQTLTINGQYDYSIFSAARSSGFEGDELSISGLTLFGGYANYGGAIYGSNSTLTVSDSVITGNRATVGGGIFTGTFYTTIRGSTISDNYALKNGGGLAGTFYPSGYIGHSTFSGNFAYYDGGGLYLYQPTMTVADSTIYDNTAFGGVSATGYGGGISTFNSNSLLYELYLFDDTVASNYAFRGGGGVFGDGGTNIPSIYNTIAADNVSGPGGASQDDLAGAFHGSFDLVEDGGAALTEDVAGSNITGVDPQLQPLDNNGGPTQTQAPLASSPAVDAGVAAGYADCGGTGCDQRYLSRPVDLPTIANSVATGGDGSDIGAFELQSLTDSQPAPPSGGGGAAAATPPPTSTPPPTCKGKAANVFRANGRTLTGTNKRDVIVGTSKKDQISSRGGNDLICAKGGNDTVNGGGGKDKLYGQGGKDKLLGKGGKDKLVGGGGNDTCVGGPGRDVEKSC
jgi:Ca2+-binding RTX toxin-like protein